MRWSEVVSAEPRLGAVMDEQLIAPGVLLVGSIRSDGTASISAVEPLLVDGTLWLSMMRHSVKARDLRRDHRVVLNSIVTDRAGAVEVKVQAAAREEHRPGPLAIGYDAATGAQHVARWPAREEFVREATTPT